MVHGLFFDAGEIIGTHEDGGLIYDREYTAADFADYYAALITNGVFANRDANACKVGFDDEMITVSPGRIFINGYQGILDGTDKFNVVQSGKYRVIVRLDLDSDVREFSVLMQGGEEFSELVRYGNQYDMCLATIVFTNYKPTITDTRGDYSVCGFCSAAGQPAYQPPGDISSLMWQYTLFPESLTPEQIAIVDSNRFLREQFINSRLLSPYAPWLNRLEFKTTQTWTCPEGVTSIDVIAVGGGGGGGRSSQSGNSAAAHGGGGGGRFVFRRKVTVVPGTVYTITIGAGGIGGVGTTAVAGTTGGASSAFGVTAAGGSGSSNATGGSGGSGGGGGGTGTGGNGGSHGCHGGTGAGNSSQSNAGVGARALDQFTYDPYTLISYSGGGGGGSAGATSGGGGGLTGGGTGGGTGNAGAGAANTGGGGGGAATGDGGNGGSGIVIIYY